MDLSSVLATKDRYMSKKYADSSDEEITTDKTDLKLFTLKTNPHRKRKKTLKNNIHNRNRNFELNAEKPCLHVNPCSAKKPFVITGDIQVPSSINQYLREYQRDGVMFMWSHFQKGTGCVLADDMGLGKTIQVVAFFAAVLKKTGFWKNDLAQKEKKENNITFLVVAPKSVLYNWQDELDTWGYFKVGKFHGKSRDDVIDKVKDGKLEVILTTHDTMRLYIDILCSITWSAVIIDEAHRIKEATSLLTIAAKKLTGKCRIGLTGTPLQNNLSELWCILDWANPGCLGTSEEFDENFAQSLYYGQRYDVNKRDLATARKKQQEFSMLHARWLLRRTKDMISTELPKKYEKIVFCSLSPLQVALYEEVLKLPKVNMLLAIDEQCQCGSELLARKCCQKFFNRRKETFPHMQLLLKLSNHASLLLPHHRQTEEQIQLAKGICESLFQDFPILEDLYKHRNFATMSNPCLSGKMVVLEKLFPILQNRRDKVLLFSHSTKLLDILEAYVMSCGLIYRRLDGNTSAQDRNFIVKEFNSDSNIFLCLLSTTAGSLGLNFTSANFVVIFDPMWNPTHDQQAQDRAYRIGQQRDVHVYRFISVGTIEENIYMRQIYKQQLSNTALVTSTERRYFASVPGDKRYHGELFGLRNIFKFSKDHTSSFTKDTFEKVKRIENEVVVADYTPVVNIDAKKGKTKSFRNADCFEIQASQCITDSSESEDGLEDDASLNPPLYCRKKIMMDDVEDEAKHDRTVLKKKEKSISDVLVDCGVSFVHSTKSLVGSSKKEQHLSKRAIDDVFWNGINSQQLANDEHGLEESQDFEPKKQPINVAETTRTSSSRPIGPSHRIFERIGDDMFIIGSTPPAIQARQFKEIAESQGFSSVEEFALKVSNGNCEWKTILRDFYSDKYPVIKTVSSFEQIYDIGKKDAQSNSKRPNDDRISNKTMTPRVARKCNRMSANRKTNSTRQTKKQLNSFWRPLYSNNSSVEIDEFDTDNSEIDGDSNNPNGSINVGHSKISIHSPKHEKLPVSNNFITRSTICTKERSSTNQRKEEKLIAFPNSEASERTNHTFPQKRKHGLFRNNIEGDLAKKNVRTSFLKPSENINVAASTTFNLPNMLSNSSSIIDELMSTGNKSEKLTKQSYEGVTLNRHCHVDELLIARRETISAPSKVGESRTSLPSKVGESRTSLLSKVGESRTSLPSKVGESRTSSNKICHRETVSILDELIEFKPSSSSNKREKHGHYVVKINETSILDELMS